MKPTNMREPKAFAVYRWRREWKFELIEASNPEWRDLWPGLMGFEDEGDGLHDPGLFLKKR